MMKSAKSKRQLTLLTLVVALGVAVYLNWEYARTDAPFALQPAQETAADADGAVLDELAQEAGAEAQPVLEALPDKNYGEAQLVSAGTASGDEYFEQARLTRTKTRDEALDTLQKTLQDTHLSDGEKEQLTQDLTKVISDITLESEIENLVKAKGFADCVAFLDGEAISLAVKTTSEGLSVEEVAQLRDIILGKADVAAQDISIVEVK